MKLNNHGWGTAEFVFSIVAILVFLLIVAFNVHNLYGSFDNTETNNNTSSNNTSNQSNNTNKVSENVDNNDVSEDTNNEQDVEYNASYYTDYQSKMIDATRNYVIYSTPSIPGEGLKVDLLTLINKNYIDSLKDMVDGTECNGYSMIFLEADSSLNIKTYLNCSNYVTEGYLGG